MQATHFDSKGGGTAILVRSTIKHTQCPTSINDAYGWTSILVIRREYSGW